MPMSMPMHLPRPMTAAVQMGLGTVAVHARRLWALLSVIFVAWALLFFSVSDATAGQHSASQTAQLVWRSINRGVIPSLVGGPWTGNAGCRARRWVLRGVDDGRAGVAGGGRRGDLAVRTRIGAVAVLVCAALYVVVAQIPVMWNRSSANTALELVPQTPRHSPDSAAVLTAALALLVAVPRRSVNFGPTVGWAPCRSRGRRGDGGPRSDSGVRQSASRRSDRGVGVRVVVDPDRVVPVVLDRRPDRRLSGQRQACSPTTGTTRCLIRRCRSRSC